MSIDRTSAYYGEFDVDKDVTMDTVSKMAVFKIIEEAEQFNLTERDEDPAVFVAVENTLRLLKHRIGDLPSGK